ncbi:hypothetical protein BKA67DRAFT_26293 [Truncatella angustata]|uniref:C2H2-type domain-containing protein n=1 Tax=Truncatella angustata TaxID=152316 RepID=A0A9P8UX05_9PEZI|nr:uncharacterized protein BKA67DRAFT_26293 [Truncatella angustata]KAH6659730.1 hypothetical protein BKA67DRAFT_26293 [Truncatella angustata]
MASSRRTSRPQDSRHLPVNHTIQSMFDSTLETSRDHGRGLNVIEPPIHNFSIAFLENSDHTFQRHNNQSPIVQYPSAHYSQYTASCSDDSRMTAASSTDIPLLSSLDSSGTTQSTPSVLYEPWYQESFCDDMKIENQSSFSYGQEQLLCDPGLSAPSWADFSNHALSGFEPFVSNPSVSHLTLYLLNGGHVPQGNNNFTNLTSTCSGQATPTSAHAVEPCLSYQSYETERQRVVPSGSTNKASPMHAPLPSGPGKRRGHRRKASDGGISRKYRNLSNRKVLYICTIDGCDHQFSSAKDLDRHQHASLIHEEQCSRKYHCDNMQCSHYGRGYTRKDNFDRHVEMMHSKLIP